MAGGVPRGECKIAGHALRKTASRRSTSPYEPSEKCYDEIGSAETATMPIKRSMKSEEPLENGEMGRVLRFEPRRGSRPHPRPSPAPFGPPPVDDVDKYARNADESDDYRHRMRANLAAIVVVGLLIWCGYWLFDTIAEMRKSQDCVLSGRTNCARISVPPSMR